MKKLQLYISFLLALSISLAISSCETVVTFPIPDIGERIVVNSTLQSDIGIATARLTVSKGALDNDGFFEDINDAAVRLYEDGNFIGDLDFQGAGVYGLNIFPDVLIKQGKTYHMEIDAPGYPSVSAETTMPFEAANAFTELVDTVTIADLTYIRYRLHFDDPAGEENFYFVDIIEASFGSLCFASRENDFVTYNDAFETIEDGVQFFCGQQLFSDKSFDGGDPDLELLIPLDGFLPPTVELEVLLGSVPRDFFLNRTTTDLQYFTQDNPFAQPVTVYTNIENGFGSLTGFMMQRIPM